MDTEGLREGKGRIVDGLIDRALEGNIPNLNDAVRYHMGTGGKKVRPLLAIMSYEALGGKDEKIMPFAAACELFHNWLLVHDDIEDGDRVRRDKLALWVKYGLAHGINAGDYMAQKVFQLILSSKDSDVSDDKIAKLVGIVADAAIKTAEGQALDINLRGNNAPTEKQYLDMVIGKTAHYLTVPMTGAAVLAGKEDLVKSLVEFGSNLGPAFQITDDLLDLTDGKGRGETGRDIKEGKKSMLVIHCLSCCTAAEKEKLLSILKKPPEKTDGDDVAYAKKLFEKYHSIDYARKRAQDFTEKAKKIAGTMPKQLRDVLYFFSDYVLQRRK